MSWEVDMLSKVEGGKKWKELRSEVIGGIVKMNIEIASDEELVGCGSSWREETVELFEENWERFRECRRPRRTVDVEDRYIGMRELESNRRGLKGGEGLKCRIWNSDFITFKL